jgi:hypothetical protein
MSTEIVIKREVITTEQAILYLVNGHPADTEVMAQNYDSDCPNYEDHDIDPDTGDEVCECWDGLDAEDVETWRDEDSNLVDREGFAEWGPFALWTTRTI